MSELLEEPPSSLILLALSTSLLKRPDLTRKTAPAAKQTIRSERTTIKPVDDGATSGLARWASGDQKKDADEDFKMKISLR